MNTDCPFWSGCWRCLIRLKRIYYFWCSMLVFTQFALCFVTLRSIFMWFLELTYWQDATVSVPYFLLFLCFRKATQEIFSELDETTTETPIFLGRRTRTERESEGARGLAHHRVVRPPSWPCPLWVRPPWSTFDDALSPMKSFMIENPKWVGVFPRTVPQRHRRRRQISGDRSLCSGTLPGQGSAPEAISIAVSAISIDLTAISITVAASDDEEGVVLPLGWGLYR
jgi:hypothetical protein